MASLCTSYIFSGRPVVGNPRSAAARRSCKSIAPQAAINLYQVADVADKAAAQVGNAAVQAGEAANFGDVSAPDWVLPAGVVAVTLASILSGYLLKPGADASDEIKKRDAESGRFTK